MSAIEVNYLRKENERLKQALQRIWDECEMGYITTDGSPDRECGLCGNVNSHAEHCLQGIVEQALATPREIGQLEDSK